MRTIIENSIIVLSLVFLAFTVLDHYNAQMDFMGNAFAGWLLILYCVLSIINSMLILGRTKRRRRKETAHISAARS